MTTPSTTTTTMSGEEDNSHVANRRCLSRDLTRFCVTCTCIRDYVIDLLQRDAVTNYGAIHFCLIRYYFYILGNAERL